MHHVVIVGGGIAGLAAAHGLQRRAAADGGAVRVSLVEATGRFGGKVLTHRRDGFVIEAGPDAFVPYKPWALALVRELGLESMLAPSRDDRAGIDVVSSGRPTPMPPGLPMLVPTDWPALLRTPLLSWRAKLRLAGERDIARRTSDTDESVADFVRRRCGEEVLERVAEPLLASLHVGDVERMSVSASIPRLAALEREHGSLAAGVAQVRRPSGGASPLFWSLEGGLGTLIEALVDRVPPEARFLGRRPSALQPVDGGWDVTLDDGTRLEADGVILATPAAAAAGLLEPLDAHLAHDLRRLRTASVAVATIAFRAEDVQTPRGFGFFVPRAEGRAILAGTWMSSKFDRRAPKGTLLARIFLGGTHGEAIVERPEEEIRGTVGSELAALFGLEADPVLFHLDRWPAGYPQYDVGHEGYVADLAARMPDGLRLAGSAFFGVGLPDCIRSGTAAAEALLTGLAPRKSRLVAGEARPCLG